MIISVPFTYLIFNALLPDKYCQMLGTEGVNKRKRKQAKNQSCRSLQQKGGKQLYLHLKTTPAVNRCWWHELELKWTVLDPSEVRAESEVGQKFPGMEPDGTSISWSEMIAVFECLDEFEVHVSQTAKGVRKKKKHRPSDGVQNTRGKPGRTRTRTGARSNSSACRLLAYNNQCNNSHCFSKLTRSLMKFYSTSRVQTRSKFHS